jgi:hypothetical protein
VGSY